nr:MAG TPA: bacteriocin [Caudoviricetes sp.]
MTSGNSWGCNGTYFYFRLYRHSNLRHRRSVVESP